VIAAFVISLVQAFLLGYFLEATIGMIGFWFLDVSSLLFVYMLFNFFCSGQMFPLDILPSPWNTIVQALPLQYMAYFPAAVFLQKISGAAMWQGLAVQFAWIVFFVVACRVAFIRGVRRYSAYGG
jgi:ABC-2 type transport system permease protein